jgi:hypothetical protein
MALPKITEADITEEIAKLLAFFDIERIEEKLAYVETLKVMELTANAEELTTFEVNDLACVAINIAICKYGLVVKKYYEEEGYKPENE